MGATAQVRSAESRPLIWTFRDHQNPPFSGSRYISIRMSLLLLHLEKRKKVSFPEPPVGANEAMNQP